MGAPPGRRNDALRLDPPLPPTSVNMRRFSPSVLSSVPEAGAPGRVFVAGPEGTPQPIAVRLGISDGATTEILAGEIAEGAAVITGGGPKLGTPTASADETSPAQRRRGPRLF